MESSQHKLGLDGEPDLRASPFHRHQSSLEEIINFASGPSFTDTERQQAKGRFYNIVGHFEANNANKSRGYNRPALVRLTYEFACSEESQDNYLRAFFENANLPLEGPQVFDLKASAKQTPQPTPATHSAVEKVAGPQDFVGTRDRVSALRRDCLDRDHHRCVISRAFHYGEAEKRLKGEHQPARDDNGVPLVGPNTGNIFSELEVAHILPHSLTKSHAEDSQLNLSRQTALFILNMFDHGVVHIIDGVDIDRPRNAITLTLDLHRRFGEFKIFFEPVIPPNLPGMGITFPVTRTLLLAPNRTIDAPSPRLLALHRAIGHILHLSAAGAYIDDMFRDLEMNGVSADGSTDLAQFVKLGLGGWLDGTINAY
ncbi:hypothetical protein PT974_10098 [Cladobotryum mycophilum]|uniref:HNH nuclease domain-containing protein n=1 Tax=Cladobotryum mycophilum TaxID=491253 RepID=A0ABR0S8X7_9HYPO